VFGEGGAGITGLITTRPEQTVFCISTSEKQALWLRLKLVVTSSGHGSVPPATYANKEMVAALARLMDKKQAIQLTEANTSMFDFLGRIEKGGKGFVMKNIRLFKPVVGGVLRNDPKILSLVSNTISLTNISNPQGSTNQIAQEVTATLDCRLLPGTDYHKFIAGIQKSLRNAGITISVDLNTVNASGSEIANEFYQNFTGALRFVYAGAEVVPYLFPAYTDNNYFRNLGIPVYGIKPVRLPHELLTSIHNIDERLPISSLLDGTDVYVNFLNRMLYQQSTASIKKSGSFK
jgi:carboxypeptidase PM20D1